MSNNASPPHHTGGTHWIEYLPGYSYCFVPSFEANRGNPYVYRDIPDFLKDFSFFMEIKEVWNQELYILTKISL